jgi:hypothetical protein
MRKATRYSSICAIGMAFTLVVSATPVAAAETGTVTRVAAGMTTEASALRGLPININAIDQAGVQLRSAAIVIRGTKDAGTRDKAFRDAQNTMQVLAASFSGVSARAFLSARSTVESRYRSKNYAGAAQKLNDMSKALAATVEAYMRGEGVKFG